MAKTARRPPLFAPTPSEDSTEHPWYRECRDHRSKKAVKAALSRVWNRYGNLIPERPNQFVSEFRRDFPARSWELYVLAWLVRSGAVLSQSPAIGPDFCATHPDIGRFWVECVVPTHGKGDDSVPHRAVTQRVGSLGPSEPVALRYTSVIGAKVKKVSSYRTRGIVAATDPVIIAVNQGAIDLSVLHDVDVPLIMRVLYGIGETTLEIDPYTRTERITVPPMVSIRNRKGSEVSTVIFGEAASTSISAVLFAQSSIFNLLPSRRRLLYLAHNPCALIRLPAGVLPVQGEAWVASDRSLRHRGVIGDYGPLSRRSRAMPTTS